MEGAHIFQTYHQGKGSGWYKQDTFEVGRMPESLHCVVALSFHAYVWTEQMCGPFFR